MTTDEAFQTDLESEQLYLEVNCLKTIVCWFLLCNEREFLGNKYLAKTSNGKNSRRRLVIR